MAQVKKQTGKVAGLHYKEIGKVMKTLKIKSWSEESMNLLMKEFDIKVLPKKQKLTLRLKVAAALRAMDDK